MNIKDNRMYKEYFTKEGWSYLYDVWKIKQWHIYVGMAAAEFMGMGGMIIAAIYIPQMMNLLLGITALVIGLILLGIWAWVHTRLNWVGKDECGHKVPIVEGKM
jgi:hypothetical protein